MNLQTLAKQSPAIFATPRAEDDFDPFRSSYIQYCAENGIDCDEDFDPVLDGPAPQVDEIQYSVWLDAHLYESSVELVKSRSASFKERFEAASWLLSDVSGPCTIHSYAAKIGIPVKTIIDDLDNDHVFLRALKRLKTEYQANRDKKAKRAPRVSN